MRNNNIAIGLAVVAVIIALAAFLFPQSTPPVQNAGGTRFPNGISVATSSQTRMINAGSGAATTTLDLGKACFLITTDNGTPLYAWFHVGDGRIGAFATSS